MNLTINTRRTLATIAPEIYGNFSEHLGRCIYGGLFVGENSPIPNVAGMRTEAVQALKKIKLPVLRWPGGCFADEYHWKDGIGPRETRKKMINTNWGGVTEDNSFGTHEFMELCRQIGCQPYINGNVGSGTVQEMAEWIEYLTFDGVSPMADERGRNGQTAPWKLKYFGIGNENWGCGGNMTPEYYANEFRRYNTFVKNFSGNRIYRIACGANAGDLRWTEVVMRECARFMDGISLHYYTIPSGNWGKKGSATKFDENEYYATLSRTLYMNELIEKHGAIVKRYGGGRVKLLVDEWGTWYDVEPGTHPGFLYQQNTMRDALVASLNLDIFNRHADIVGMANLAQLCNVLQALILTDGEQMVLTPTYHVFDLYKHHQGGALLDSFAETDMGGTDEWRVPKISQSASKAEDGTVHLTVSNTTLTEEITVDCAVLGMTPSAVKAEIVTGAMADCNDFGTAAKVAAADYDGVSLTSDGCRIVMKPCSVVHVALLP